jgi:CRP-like cAMP-binding protein
VAKRRRALNVQGQNALLAFLPDKELDHLQPRLTSVSMAIRDVVYQPNGPIRDVYFPLSGVFSLLVVMSDGAAVEFGTIGNEGMVGIPVFLGSGTSPHRVIAQVPGEALRMGADEFEDELARGGTLSDVLKRYNQALLNQMAYSVACNRLHSIEERMCRWLLMTHDRVGTDQFPLTQEFLALMLGVRRPSVTVAAGVLQRAGLIAYGRGRVLVLDRPGLEAASCECYAAVKAEFERLIG